MLKLCCVLNVISEIPDVCWVVLILLRVILLVRDIDRLESGVCHHLLRVNRHVVCRVLSLHLVVWRPDRVVLIWEIQNVLECRRTLWLNLKLGITLPLPLIRHTLQLLYRWSILTIYLLLRYLLIVNDRLIIFFLLIQNPELPLHTI